MSDDVSDVLALKRVDASDQEAVNEALSDVVRRHGVTVEQMDGLDEHGHVRVRIHSPYPGAMQAAVDDVTRILED